MATDKVKHTAIPKLDLIDYARRFLDSLGYGNFNSTNFEQAAMFADQLRAGCHQDLVRLIKKMIEDTPNDVSGKEALHNFGCTITEGGDINLWGMPDCACKKSNCVYCGRGLAVEPLSKAEPKP